MTQTILVIGATGFVGARAATQLLKDGFNLRVLAHDPHKARQLFPEQVEIIPGGVEDASALETALAGVQGVLISVSWRKDLEAVQAVTGLLVRQGRIQTRVGYVSGATVLPENRWFGMTTAKLQAEEALMKSGIAYTIFRPNWFMESLALFVRDGRATIFGKQRQPIPFISQREFSQAVSQAFQTTAAANQVFTFNGPQSLRMDAALQRYCDRFHPGVKVSVAPIWLGNLLAAATRSPQLKDFVQMMGYFEKGPQVSQAGLGGEILPKPALSFDEWLAEKAG